MTNVMSGPDLTGVKSNALSWTLLGLLGLAILILLLAAAKEEASALGKPGGAPQLPDGELARATAWNER